MNSGVMDSGIGLCAVMLYLHLQLPICGGYDTEVLGSRSRYNTVIGARADALRAFSEPRHEPLLVTDELHRIFNTALSSHQYQSVS